jgi:hypothetical protein
VDTTTLLEALQVLEDSRNRSLEAEAATTSSTATSMDLLAVLVDSVGLLASSWVVEATITTSSSSILVTTSMDLLEVLADSQGWQARSWEVAAHLAVVTNPAEANMDQAKPTAMAEAVLRTTPATSNTVVVASNTTDLIKIKATAAAVAVVSSAALQVAVLVATNPTTVVDTDTRQEEVPAEHILALRHQPLTSLPASTANLLKATALTLGQELILARHHPKALLLNLVPMRLLVATNRTDSNLTVHRSRAVMEDNISRQVLTADHLNNMVTTKVAMVLQAMLVVTDSHRAATVSLKVDMADNKLLEATAAEGTSSSSMATAATEGNMNRRSLFGYREMTWSLRWGKLMTVHENACAHD